MPPSHDDYPYTVRSQTITLEWDPPTVQFPSRSLLITHYRLYSRPHNTVGWRYLREVPATGSPQFDLDHADFGNGSFDFAVSTISASGIESTFHSSLDDSAYPYGGWYLVWIVN